MKYLTIINNEQFEIEIGPDGTLTVNGEPHEVDFLALDESLFSIITDDKSLELAIEENKGQYEVLLGGRLYEGQVLDERALLMANRKGGLMLNSGDVTSPMPGLIVEVSVSEGQTVEANETVVVLESMKMQNELKAPRSGVVEAVNVAAGQTVDKGALLVVISEPEE